MLEFRFALLLMANREVLYIQDQPPPVRYRLPGERKYRTHTFDWLVFYRDGSREYYECKAADQVEKEDVEALVELINAEFLDDTADIAIVVDEDMVHPALAENAEDVVEARKCRNDADCRTVLEYMQRQHDPISMDDVCDAFADSGWARTALLNLIYDGLVEHLDPTASFEDAPLVRTVLH